MYGPRCVVDLLQVVPSSDRFWCNQVKIFRECAFQGGHSPASCPLVMAPRAQPRSHSFGFPCSGASIRALPFATAHQFALSFSWRRVDSRSPFHGGASGLRQPSDGSTLPSRLPSRSGWIRLHVGTHIGDRPLRLGRQSGSIGYSVGLRMSHTSCGGITPVRDSSQGILSFSCGWGGWCVLVMPCRASVARGKTCGSGSRAPSQGGIRDYAENRSGVAVGVFCVV